MYCCFTGHRPESLPWICNEDSAECIKLKNVLKSVIEEAISELHKLLGLSYDTPENVDTNKENGLVI